MVYVRVAILHNSSQARMLVELVPDRNMPAYILEQNVPQRFVLVLPQYIRSLLLNPTHIFLQSPCFYFHLYERAGRICQKLVEVFFSSFAGFRGVPICHRLVFNAILELWFVRFERIVVVSKSQKNACEYYSERKTQDHEKFWVIVKALCYEIHVRCFCLNGIIHSRCVGLHVLFTVSSSSNKSRGISAEREWRPLASFAQTALAGMKTRRCVAPHEFPQ